MSEATQQATITVKGISEEKITKTGKKYFGVLASDGTTWYNIMEVAMVGVVKGANVLVDFSMLGTSRWSRKTLVLGEGKLQGASKPTGETGTPKQEVVPSNVNGKDTLTLLLSAQILSIKIATGKTLEEICEELKEIYNGISGK